MRARDLPEGGKTVYTIYAKPLDFPGLYVCRRWWFGGGVMFTLDPVQNQPFARAGSLEEIRKRLPWGLVNIGREESDDPVIQESWV